MNTYRVSFYKDLCNSDGHSFKCLQRQIEVQAIGPSEALMLAERLVDNDRLNANCVEVTHLADHHEFEHPVCYTPARGRHAWNRVA
ncbi:hypothetical protein J6524_02920 [Bradyrhizobium sp. WSM 1738]|uniref:hypothetical protein n=1 Tax=Bradyrhizobium hereditatis TaxID=2821405 RepID=UPI001CE31AD0|nr:hypothetical protein [Bradyrhizobium hereditatis]MCA6113881.1 hypothetical protein [Bradyrhizobium hereditatis]